jgi:hypothetical protein
MLRLTPGDRGHRQPARKHQGLDGYHGPVDDIHRCLAQLHGLVWLFAAVQGVSSMLRGQLLHACVQCALFLL